MIRPIEQQDVENIACLAAECFLDDVFYADLSDNLVERNRILIDLFSESVQICMKYGYAYLVENDGILVAFCLWFDYGFLRKKSPESFSFIFPSGKDSVYSGKIYNELLEIEKWVETNTEYLYLLALGVKSEFRRRGIARGLVQKIIDAFPQYNLFSDISNPNSVTLYESLGFEVLGKQEGCTLVRYLSQVESCELSSSEDFDLLLPIDFALEDFFHREVSYAKIEVSYLEPVRQGGRCFRQSLCDNKTEVYSVRISYKDLLVYQRAINILNCQEVIQKSESGITVYYVVLREVDFGFWGKNQFLGLTLKTNEWELIPDVYVSIPIVYNNFYRLKDVGNSLSNSFIHSLLRALAFRTKYEAGIPVKDLNECGFKERILRFFLGYVTIQILSEDEIVFSGRRKVSNNTIGNPVTIALVISIDCMTNLGVLHLVSMSSAIPVTQLLDSVSRNQLNVIFQGRNINLYKYLKSEFGVEKMGVAKSFLSLPYDRTEVSDDLLASILFCETYYEAGESLGTVEDREIRTILQQKYGLAQYNYASVYAYTSVVVQMSSSLEGSLLSRITKESITLFYIELILFEEASIQAANEQIVSFLTNLDKYTPDVVLRSINEIISDYVQSIEFWDIQMNYPSSKKSVDDLREAFKIKRFQELIRRNKELLLTIYQIRSDIIDRKEAALLSSAGVVLAGVSSVEAIVNCGNNPILYVVLLFIVVLLIWKRLAFNRLIVRKIHKRGK